MGRRSALGGEEARLVTERRHLGGAAGIDVPERRGQQVPYGYGMLAITNYGANTIDVRALADLVIRF